MKLAFAIAATALVALATPAAAKSKLMACTGENMAKAVAGANTQPYTAKRAAMDKEVSKANTAMSKGDMRGACKSFAKAQMAMK